MTNQQYWAGSQADIASYIQQRMQELHPTDWKRDIVAGHERIVFKFGDKVYTVRVHGTDT